ncbi:S24 family peptidase [Rhizorhabdus sp. FW153]|uniref:S24 family peptidase n=1 Tax=Rhizorhabdus sp. FW153 TaxID=3400216 RepID=UPI003CFA7AE1
MTEDVRSILDELIRERGEDYSSLSRLIGRNPAYIQQFIKRGTPRRLSEEDRARIAAYLRVPEERLGGRSASPPSRSAAAHDNGLRAVPRIEVRASAGPGGVADIEERGRPFAFDPALLKEIGARRTSRLSVIRVSGESMEPTLRDRDDILVDLSATTPIPDAIHVLSLDDLLMVKRLVHDGDSWIVRSDNPDYADIDDFDPAALRIIGRVLWCGRKL